MSKTTPEAGRATGSRLWRGMAIIALVVLAACLVAGLLWFFADPLNLPPKLLDSLDQRASVIGMFSGMLLGAAGLVVAVLALRAQARAGRIPAGIAPPETAAAAQQAPPVAADGRRPVSAPADAGDNGGDERAPQPSDTDEPSTGTGKYVVDLRHAHAVQVGEHLTQHNTFHPPTDPA
ncbi:RIP homotypic interaction motif-containing protein [Streptosporangium amethystogenes]|uniref:RIP homotypic interaction motif-containing protein n=1 Tax=Streptosporangium amethystogenes TaxID=2002 RepID=UPI0004CABD3F|nr:RIP homotypic interaction motif-containing protein [Streptosporangium amethystogenes]